MKGRAQILKNILVITMVASCVAFTACGKTQNQGPINSGNENNNVSDNTDGEKPGDTDNESGQTTDGGSDDSITVDYDGYITVSSTEELCEAIKPGAYIKIEPGDYNMSGFIEMDLNVEDWNSKHTYVKFRSQFDGYEMVIQDAKGLHITGGTDNAADTELKIDPRYSAVMAFNGCEDVEISNITMGHTEGGECIGNVLDFRYCKNTSLTNVDLYGCGVYGIGAGDRCENMYVKDSIIRDCYSGPLAIEEVTGEFIFENCSFTGSTGGGYAWEENDVKLKFKNCKFDQNESNTWFFYTFAEFEDCDMMEPTYYPDFEGDYGYEDYPEFDTSDLTQLNLEDAMLTFSDWKGYVRVDSSNGNEDYLDIYSDQPLETISLYLDEKEKATFNYFGEDGEYTWKVLDEDQGMLESDNGNIYFSLYENSDHDRWLSVQYNDYLIWMVQ